jgi:hypothetical protein
MDDYFEDDEFSLEDLFNDELETKLNLTQPKAAPVPKVVPTHKSRLQVRFEAFHRQNPHVFDAIEVLTWEMKKWKWPKASISLIYERLRWIHAIKTQGDKYKLSNDFRAYYARLVMAKNPALKGFFGLRTQDQEYIIDWVALNM